MNKPESLCQNPECGLCGPTGEPLPTKSAKDQFQELMNRLALMTAPAVGGTRAIAYIVIGIVREPDATSPTSADCYVAGVPFSQLGADVIREQLAKLGIDELHTLLRGLDGSRPKVGAA